MSNPIPQPVFGDNNIALGTNADGNLTTGSDNIDIGNKGVVGEAAEIRIGTVGTQTPRSLPVFHDVAVTGTPVEVSTNGQLGMADLRKDLRKLSSDWQTKFGMDGITLMR